MAAQSNYGHPVNMVQTDNSLIKNNTFSSTRGSTGPIWLTDSHNNTIIGNDMNFAGNLIYVLDSDYNSFIENTLTLTSTSSLVRLRDSTLNNLTNNTFTTATFNNFQPALIVTSSLYDDYNHTFTDNTLFGKPLLYRFAVTDEVVENSEMGSIWYVHSKNITVNKVNMSSHGLHYIWTNDSFVNDSYFDPYSVAIELENSRNITVRNNTVNISQSNSIRGLELTSTFNSTISLNNITSTRASTQQ